MNAVNEYNFIAIEGVIGAGKTSLATMLARELNARLILEQFEDNDFLPKFYEEPDKYAFPLELSFLASRFQQLNSQLLHPDLFQPVTVSDYIINKSLIFSQNTLPEAEYNLYVRLFQLMHISIPRPDLLVYLHADIRKLQDNIAKRGRPYEKKIEDSYLKGLQEGYFHFMRQQKDLRILILDVNNVDFVGQFSDYGRIRDLILQTHPAGITTVEL